MVRFLPLAAVVFLAVSFAQADSVVRFQTQFGNAYVQLFDQQTPQTVANFLGYVDSGQYQPTVFHYLGQGILQGGAWTATDGSTLQRIPAASPVANEPGIPNARGSLAMAKAPGDPNSATSEFFFNLTDNTSLDTQNGGYTVFGKVISGMNVVDFVGALPTDNGVPVFPYLDQNYLVQTSITRAVPGDSNDDGVVDVLDLGVLASNWQATGADWAHGDFNGDGVVDVLDLGILASNWQSSAGNLAAAEAAAGLTAPEPATVALLGLGAAALLRGRKR